MRAVRCIANPLKLKAQLAANGKITMPMRSGVRSNRRARRDFVEDGAISVNTA